MRTVHNMTDIEKGYEMVVQAESNLGAVDHTKDVVLEWKNINYSVSLKETPDQKKSILTNINGIALPGELLGVLGTSGAGIITTNMSYSMFSLTIFLGKSTLLDVLAGRLDSIDLSGSLLRNGKEIDRRQFRRETGYVMQSDALFPFLTVKETIRFAAYLRVQNKTREEKNAIADETIKLLKMESAVDTIIGNDEVRGISGGQKRRVSIGVDIVSPILY